MAVTNLFTEGVALLINDLGDAVLPGREVYDAGSPGYRGRCTAPLLVDARSRALVCNESADIVRMLNELRGLPGSSAVDLRPPQLAAEIDAVNALVQDNVRCPSAVIS